MKNINLAGISGRAGSGKDTVAKMIQIITTDGLPRDLVDKYKLNPDGFLPHIHFNKSPWQIRKYAGKLKKIASILTGIPVEKFEDQEFKKSNLTEEWDYYTLEWEGFDGDAKELHKSYSVREFLQRLGTDALRNNLHENVWINAMFADYSETTTSRAERYFDNRVVFDVELPSKWIITDVRFPNEMEAIKERNGINIRLTRNEHVESSHASETALDGRDDWDYVIDNKNQSLEETFEDVVKMVEYFKLK